MPVITYTPESCSIVASGTDRLVDLSFALEFMSNNFLGRGVYRWSVTREPTLLFQVVGKALCKSGPLQVSQVCQLGGAVQQNLIPHDIPLKESFNFEHKGSLIAKDGQNLRNLYANKNENIIESHDINPHVLLASYSYGFADMVTGLFALGVKEVKYQISRMTSQLYIKHNLPDERLLRYFQSQGNDYDIEATVSSLP